MEKTIARIMNDPNITNKDILELADMFVDHYDLRDYVKDIHLDAPKHLGCYNPYTKEIYVSIDRLLESSFKTCVAYEDDYYLRLDRMYMLSILHTLLHELNHARQSKEAESSVDDTLHAIIREGIDLGRRNPLNLDKREKILLNLHYSRVLIERNAEIEAIYALLEYRNSRAFNIQELNYLRDYLNQLISHGYLFNQNPCKTYYKLRHKKHEYDMLDFNDKDYDLLTKLSWGFPIDKDTIKTPDKFHLIRK